MKKLLYFLISFVNISFAEIDPTLYPNIDTRLPVYTDTRTLDALMQTIIPQIIFLVLLVIAVVATGIKSKTSKILLVANILIFLFFIYLSA